jgi:ADP-dependent NAD(P)H-hydrate dehydratase / NAD(P)H-hydrate epimerase
MRHAAEQIAVWIDLQVTRSHQRHALGLIGPGNNGGDALVALALLSERGWRCSCVLLGRDVYGELPANEQSLSAVRVVGVSELIRADVIIDGVYGIGGRATVPDNVASAFRLASDARLSRRTPLIAIDVPSGTDATTGAASEHAFQADVTLCLGFIKRGLVREPAASCAGDITLLPIGLQEPRSPSNYRMVTAETVQRALPRRRATSHKSDTGTALVVGGAPTYYGAPRLAAEAALRSGAGLVALATPERVVPVIAGQLPEIVFVGLPGNADAAVQAIRSFIEDRSSTLRSVVIGPGIGRGSLPNALMSFLFPAETANSLSAVDHAPRIVIDADGLNWLSERVDWHSRLVPRTVILTPHAGEMSRLMRIPRTEVIEAPHEIVRLAAERWQQYIVLKAGVTSVASPEGALWVAPRATPELATAGTGDVLAGTIGGLLAQGMEPLDASACGVFIGAIAGQMARDEHSTASVTASDVISNIGRVMHSLQRPLWGA